VSGWKRQQFAEVTHCILSEVFSVKTNILVFTYNFIHILILLLYKLRRMRWAGHVARMGRGEVCTGFWWGSLREGDHWGDPDVNGRIILRWIFRKWEGVVGTGWSRLRIGTGGGHL
jgi:hypothetical protein